MDGCEPQHPAIRGLKTVCRCNNIKYRTIERAIREGAWTLSHVVLRTTATTGHCGGSCTFDVLDMLAEHKPKHVVPSREDGEESGPGCTSHRRPDSSRSAALGMTDPWWVRKK